MIEIEHTPYWKHSEMIERWSDSCLISHLFVIGFEYPLYSLFCKKKRVKYACISVSFVLNYIIEVATGENIKQLWIFFRHKGNSLGATVKLLSRVQILETTSCVKNRVRLCTIHQLMRPLPGPCVCGTLHCVW
jgi:hypothetical protein